MLVSESRFLYSEANRINFQEREAEDARKPIGFVRLLFLL